MLWRSQLPTQSCPEVAKAGHSHPGVGMRAVAQEHPLRRRCRLQTAGGRLAPPTAVVSGNTCLTAAGASCSFSRATQSQDLERVVRCRLPYPQFQGYFMLGRTGARSQPAAVLTAQPPPCVVRGRTHGRQRLHRTAERTAQHNAWEAAAAPSQRGAAASVKKNWLLLVFLPELAIDTAPAASCFNLSPAFSSLNLPP